MCVSEHWRSSGGKKNQELEEVAVEPEKGSSDNIILHQDTQFVFSLNLSFELIKSNQ